MTVMKEKIRKWYGQKVSKSLRPMFIEGSIYEKVLGAYQDYIVKITFLLPFQMLCLIVFLCILAALPFHPIALGIMAVVIGIFLMILSMLLLRHVKKLQIVLKVAKQDQIALLEKEQEKYHDNLALFSYIRKLEKGSLILILTFIATIVIVCTIWPIIGLSNDYDLDLLFDGIIWSVLAVALVYLFVYFIVLVKFNMKTMVLKQKILASLEQNELNESSEDVE